MIGESMEQHMYYYDTVLGTIGIGVNDGSIVALTKVNEMAACYNINGLETSTHQQAMEQLMEYLEGKRKEFQLPLKPTGTAFQQKVWERLLTIPYGETRSYGEIAKEVGNGKASRAVGMANNRNPIMIFIPCHRVIGSTGKLVGYGGGLDVKIHLLELEGATHLGI